MSLLIRWLTEPASEIAATASALAALLRREQR